jgi:acyl-CoA dehydrogenase
MSQSSTSGQPAALRERLLAFMDEHIYPNEPQWHAEREANTRRGARWEPIALIEALKARAQQAGLWNLWWPKSHGGQLTNAEYAPLCEIMGRVHWAPEVFNCSAPDTGNMETLLRYGSSAQQAQWLTPLAEGRIRSCFAMTEPDVASSDATNIQSSIRREGDSYLINGRKWWSSGAPDPRCKVFIFMGKTDPQAPRHLQQSMILVPREASGVTVVRPLTLFGYDDAPHGHAEVRFVDVRVPADSILLGEGRGFEIAQGRLGPGRIHHCMRLIGQAERALELMCRRLQARVAFGRPVAEQSVWHERIAESRIAIDSARLMVLEAARMIDESGSKSARNQIAMIKVLAPNVALKVIDWAIQAHGGGGMCDDFELAYMYAWNRSLRLADGPDEVHRNAIAKSELGRYRPAAGPATA